MAVGRIAWVFVHAVPGSGLEMDALRGILGRQVAGATSSRVREFARRVHGDANGREKLAFCRVNGTLRLLRRARMAGRRVATFKLD